MSDYANFEKSIQNDLDIMVEVGLIEKITDPDTAIVGYRITQKGIDYFNHQQDIWSGKLN